MKNKIFYSTILSIFFIAFYIQNRYAIFSIDDWTYAFIVNENAFNYQSVADDDVLRKPINSFKDAIKSQSIDYFKTNGRFIIHTTVQYICGTKTMSQFVFLNSIVFVIFTILIILLSKEDKNIINLLLILSSIWLLIPHKGMTFMGNVTCSIDYLWSCVGTLIFIYIIENIISKNHINNKLLLPLSGYAIIAGSLQESFSIGISGTFILLVILNKKNINKKILFIFLCYLIGNAICMFTPANFRRFDDIGGLGFHPHSILGILSSPLSYLFILSIIFIYKKKVLTEIFKENFIILCPIIINTLFALFIAYNGRHQLTAINVFILIFILRIWIKFSTKTINKKITILFVCISIISYYPILYYRKSYYDSYMMIIKRANTNNNNGIVSGKEFEENTIRIKNNRILECNYIATFTFQNWDFFERSLSIYLTKGKNNRYIEDITIKD